MAAETVHKFLAVDALNELPLVVVAERAAEFVEVHVLVVLLVAPPSCDGVWVHNSELQARFVVCVPDDLRVTFLKNGV
jgi:hypothetical protein